jgi:hypothetical protein
LFHWKVGFAPPLVIVTENVTFSPLQILNEGDADINTVGDTVDNTVNELDIAVFAVLQVEFEVIKQVTTSLGFSVAEKVAPPVPTLKVFTFH